MALQGRVGGEEFASVCAAARDEDGKAVSVQSVSGVILEYKGEVKRNREIKGREDNYLKKIRVQSGLHGWRCNISVNLMLSSPWSSMTS